MYRYFTNFQSKGYAHMQSPHHTKAACFSLSLPSSWISDCSLRVWHIHICSIPHVSLQYDWQSQCLLDFVLPPCESHLRFMITLTIEYGKSNGICVLSPDHEKKKWNHFHLAFSLCLDVQLWNLATKLWGSSGHMERSLIVTFHQPLPSSQRSACINCQLCKWTKLQKNQIPHGQFWKKRKNEGVWTLDNLVK